MLAKKKQQQIISKTVFFIRNILYKNEHALHIFIFSIDSS